MTTYEQVRDRLIDMARDSAANAAQTWVNETLRPNGANAADVLELVESGTCEELPYADLSGQWSDEPTPRSILADAGYDDTGYAGEPSDEAARELVDAYESEYGEHVESEIVRILTGHADESALQTAEAFTVGDLVSLAEPLGAPDSYDPPSAGAAFLLSVRDDVLERLRGRVTDGELLADAIGSVRDGDDMLEILDGAPDVHTGTRWAEFVDLAAYHEDIREFAGPGSDMTECAGVALTVVAERLVSAILAGLER